MNSPSNEEVKSLAWCFVFGIWGLIAISSYIENGTVYLRGDISGVIALAVIVCLVVTSTIFGYQFYKSKNNKQG